MSYRPGKLKRSVTIELRPRDSEVVGSDAFGRYVAEIWHDLREEASRGIAERSAGAQPMARRPTPGPRSWTPAAVGIASTLAAIDVELLIERDQPVHRAAALADPRGDSAHRQRGERSPPLSQTAQEAHGRACCSSSSAWAWARSSIACACCARPAGVGRRAAAAPIVLMYPLFLVIFGRSATMIVMIGLPQACAGDPQDRRGPRGLGRC